jgi:hypothetical protein
MELYSGSHLVSKNNRTYNTGTLIMFFTYTIKSKKTNDAIIKI